jgi:hypothetical protein
LLLLGRGKTEKRNVTENKDRKVKNGRVPSFTSSLPRRNSDNKIFNDKRTKDNDITKERGILKCE